MTKVAPHNPPLLSDEAVVAVELPPLAQGRLSQAPCSSTSDVETTDEKQRQAQIDAPILEANVEGSASLSRKQPVKSPPFGLKKELTSCKETEGTAPPPSSDTEQDDYDSDGEGAVGPATSILEAARSAQYAQAAFILSIVLPLLLVLHLIAEFTYYVPSTYIDVFHIFIRKNNTFPAGIHVIILWLLTPILQVQHTHAEWTAVPWVYHRTERGLMCLWGLATVGMVYNIVLLHTGAPWYLYTAWVLYSQCICFATFILFTWWLQVRRLLLRLMENIIVSDDLPCLKKSFYLAQGQFAFVVGHAELLITLQAFAYAFLLLCSTFSLFKDNVSIADAFLFFIFCLVLGTLLATVASLNSVYVNRYSLVWKLRHVRFDILTGLYDFLLKNSLQFKIFGLPITWQTIGVYAVSLAVAGLGGLQDQVFSLANSGVF